MGAYSVAEVVIFEVGSPSVREPAGGRCSDRRGNSTTTTYNELNQAVEVADPLGPSTLYAYDLLGNLLTETDKRGFVTEHEYDGENRRTKTTRADVVIESTLYDPAGNRISLTDANGNTSTFEYDERNALARALVLGRRPGTRQPSPARRPSRVQHRRLAQDPPGRELTAYGDGL